MASVSRAGENVLPAIGTVAVFVLIFALLFARAMTMGFNHDEQQFVAGGQLVATHAFLPYRDFPYFHTPLLVLIDAWIFSHTDHLLLAARTASTLWAWLGLVVIFGMGLGVFRAQPSRRSLLLSFVPVGLLFVNPIFIYANFEAWNQSLPAMLMILAVACQCRGAQIGKYMWFIAAGAFLGLAIGTRLSFAPLALPFLIMAWFVPSNDHMRRIRSATAFSCGLALGFLPSAVVIAQAPMAFLLDNFAYNGPINTAYRGSGAHFWPAAWGKTMFLLKLLVQPATLFFVATFTFLNLPIANRRTTYFRRLVLAVLPFAWLGALAAFPSYTQYYYPVVTLGALAILAGLSEVQLDARRFRMGMILAGVSLAVATIQALPVYRSVFQFFDFEKWTPLQLHAEGIEMRAAAPLGMVLTLNPIVPLEGGLDIYPGFATGPFAWRTARFLTPDQRERYKFVGADELEKLLVTQPPASILTGREKRFEPPLIAYATRHKYREIKLSHKKVLWVAPASQ